MGSPVKRFYGTEILRITPEAVDLTRMESGGIPLLDHHRQGGLDSMLGRVVETWFRRGALMGRLKFNDTEEGRKAEGMVSRGEVVGVSVGYRVEEWEITDEDGKVIDPEKERVEWDEQLTFTASRWQLFEVSLVGVPADMEAGVRSLLRRTRNNEVAAIRARMMARQRMYERQVQAKLPKRNLEKLEEERTRKRFYETHHRDVIRQHLP
jgi:HK97 family phage prohead protease